MARACRIRASVMDRLLRNFIDLWIAILTMVAFVVLGFGFFFAMVVLGICTHWTIAVVTGAIFFTTCLAAAID